MKTTPPTNKHGTKDGSAYDDDTDEDDEDDDDEVDEVDEEDDTNN